MPADKFSWFKLLADTPIEQDEQDRLGFTAYADALAGLLDDPATSTPLTVAITGPWGSGKTSLAKMVEARLQRWPKERGEAPNIVCWFNAWLHDDAPNLGSAFAAEVARVAARRRPRWRQILRPLPMRMHACSCDSRRVRACTAVTYNGMPAAGIVDSSYRWRPPRHGRGAEADPRAASGAAAVSDSGRASR